MNKKRATPGNDNPTNSGKITIKHIAGISGFSFSTVAKALKNDPAIRMQTRDRIQKIADDLNYYPNRAARTLRNSRTHIIGVILNDVKNPFYAEIYSVIEDVANRNGFTMFLCDSNFDFRLERENILAMMSHGVEGLIMSPVNEQSENLELLIRNHINTVIIDCKPENQRFSSVYANHEEAATLAVSYLLDRGHRDILLLNGPSFLSSSNWFLFGYTSALKARGIPVREDLIEHMPIAPEYAYGFLKNVLQPANSLDPPKIDGASFTAIVTLSDMLALGVYRAARDIGFGIPRDYSIVGYDNIFAAEYVFPPLTTVNQPKREIGERSIRLLLKQISSHKSMTENEILEPHLIERESVQAR